MKKNKLRTLLNQDYPTISTRLWSTDPFFYEACGQSGNFDYVEFVAEYAPYDFKDLPNIIRACELSEPWLRGTKGYTGRIPEHYVRGPCE